MLRVFISKCYLVFIASIISLSMSANAQEIDTAAAKVAIAEGAVIIDVRTDREWSAGHHPDALHMQNTQLLMLIAKQNLPKDTPIVLYCRSGKRAKRSAEDLKAAGYNHVINAGGLKDLLKEQ
ncbi:MAG: Thiosulfate sulfurtransferase PspE [Glaciecola sp. HTCC2999]|nr:MAG: Thiosulfate sulfurtransferase PspE [Glaciecola sp. HTCC2999]